MDTTTTRKGKHYKWSVCKQCGEECLTLQDMPMCFCSRECAALWMKENGYNLDDEYKEDDDE